MNSQFARFARPALGVGYTGFRFGAAAPVQPKTIAPSEIMAPPPPQEDLLGDYADFGASPGVPIVAPTPPVPAPVAPTPTAPKKPAKRPRARKTGVAKKLDFSVPAEDDDEDDEDDENDDSNSAAAKAVMEVPASTRVFHQQRTAGSASTPFIRLEDVAFSDDAEDADGEEGTTGARFSNEQPAEVTPEEELAEMARVGREMMAAIPKPVRPPPEPDVDMAPILAAVRKAKDDEMRRKLEQKEADDKRKAELEQRITGKAAKWYKPKAAASASGKAPARPPTSGKTVPPVGGSAAPTTDAAPSVKAAEKKKIAPKKASPVQKQAENAAPMEVEKPAPKKATPAKKQAKGEAPTKVDKPAPKKATHMEAEKPAPKKAAPMEVEKPAPKQAEVAASRQLLYDTDDDGVVSGTDSDNSSSDSDGDNESVSESDTSSSSSDESDDESSRAASSEEDATNKLPAKKAVPVPRKKPAPKAAPRKVVPPVEDDESSVAASSEEDAPRKRVLNGALAAPAAKKQRRVPSTVAHRAIGGRQVQAFAKVRPKVIKNTDEDVKLIVQTWKTITPPLLLSFPDGDNNATAKQYVPDLDVLDQAVLLPEAYQGVSDIYSTIFRELEIRAASTMESHRQQTVQPHHLTESALEYALAFRLSYSNPTEDVRDALERPLTEDDELSGIAMPITVAWSVESFIRSLYDIYNAVDAKGERIDSHPYYTMMHSSDMLLFLAPEMKSKITGLMIDSYAENYGKTTSMRYIPRCFTLERIVRSAQSPMASPNGRDLYNVFALSLLMKRWLACPAIPSRAAETTHHAVVKKAIQTSCNDLKTSIRVDASAQIFAQTYALVRLPLSEFAYPEFARFQIAPLTLAAVRYVHMHIDEVKAFKFNKAVNNAREGPVRPPGSKPPPYHGLPLNLLHDLGINLSAPSHPITKAEKERVRLASEKYTLKQRSPGARAPGFLEEWRKFILHPIGAAFLEELLSMSSANSRISVTRKSEVWLLLLRERCLGKSDANVAETSYFISPDPSAPASESAVKSAVFICTEYLMNLTLVLGVRKQRGAAAQKASAAATKAKAATNAEVAAIYGQDDADADADKI